MTTNTTAMPCAERQNADDETLIQRAIDGDADAFETLVCRHSEKLIRLARGIVESDSDAHDVWQKAMVKIHDKLDTLRNPESFHSWAYRIVRNTALMEVRKGQRSSEIGFGDLGDGQDDMRHFESLAPDWRQKADEALEASELRDQLAEAVEELPPKYQSPLMLYEFEGYSHQEIGELLELSEAGAKSRVHRARIKLRATLERYLREDLEDQRKTAKSTQ